MRRIFILALLVPAPALAQVPDGWQQKAPRDEIKPRFTYDPKGGLKQAGSFVLSADERDGLHGWWQKTFPIVGGKYYEFHAVRKTGNVEAPRRSAVARVVWQDDKGQAVYVDPPADTQ